LHLFGLYSRFACLRSPLSIYPTRRSRGPADLTTVREVSAGAAVGIWLLRALGQLVGTGFWSFFRWRGQHGGLDSGAVLPGAEFRAAAVEFLASQISLPLLFSPSLEILVSPPFRSWCIPQRSSYCLHAVPCSGVALPVPSPLQRTTRCCRSSLGVTNPPQRRGCSIENALYPY